MYKLKIVAGPNRGATFELQDGETSIGRNPDNVIILPSNRISKKHCSVYVMNGEASVQDHGSSNGTFVNGALSRNKRVKSGDRIGLGEFILEILDTNSGRRKNLPPGMQGMDNVLQFPTTSSVGMPAAASSHTGGMIGSMSQPPSDYQEKAKWYVEKGVLPFFYDMLLKHEWKFIVFGIIAALVGVALLVSIQPMIEAHRETVIKESEKRASALARQIVEKNAVAIAAQAETKTDIGVIEREDGVDAAVLIDMKARIIAPPEKMNQYFTRGDSASAAIEAIRLFERGKKESGYIRQVSNLVVAIEPLKVFDPTLAKNTVRALAVVSIDVSHSAMEMGQVSLYYSEALTVVGVVALLLFYILYRATLKPLEVLNDDLDRVLRGELSQVTHEFKWEETNSLWSVINSMVQRIPHSSNESSVGGDTSAVIDDFVQNLRGLGELGNVGVVICDEGQRPIYSNSLFEDLTGIRADSAMGKALADLARDQAFSQMAKDMLGRAMGGSKPVEDFEFSGVLYKLVAMHQGAQGKHVYAMVMTKKDGA